MALKFDFGELKQALAVGNCYLVLAPAELFEIELAFFAHQSDIFVVRKECYQLLSLFFCFLLEDLCLALVIVEKTSLYLFLKIFAL